MKHFFYLALLSAATVGSTAHAVELSGNISIESRVFVNEALDIINQHDNYNSFAIEPELYQQWDNNQQSLNLKAFYRHDQHDDERSHGDIRELSWTGVYDNF